MPKQLEHTIAHLCSVSLYKSLNNAIFGECRLPCQRENYAHQEAGVCVNSPDQIELHFKIENVRNERERSRSQLRQLRSIQHPAILSSDSYHFRL